MAYSGEEKAGEQRRHENGGQAVNAESTDSGTDQKRQEDETILIETSDDSFGLVPGAGSTSYYKR